MLEPHGGDAAADAVSASGLSGEESAAAHEGLGELLEDDDGRGPLELQEPCVRDDEDGNHHGRGEEQQMDQLCGYP